MPILYVLKGDVVLTQGYYKKEVQIPTGHCWVEGDNHGHSFDSNTFGPVSLGLVKAKATCILWPPGRIGFLDKKEEPGRVLGSVPSINKKIKVTPQPNVLTAQD